MGESNSVPNELAHKTGFELMNGEDDEAEALSDGYGITEEDMELISAFLEKSRFERSIDDLRPSAGNKS